MVLVPVVAGIAGGLAVAWGFARPRGALQVGWWLAVLSGSAVALLVVERLARRFLPLAALLRLSLIFPDRIPSRISVAMRTINHRRVEESITEVSSDDPTLSASARAPAALSLVASLNTHDRRTRGHSERVRVLTAVVAEELDLDDEASGRLQWGALLHDIGKLTVPAEILNKPGAPDTDEWNTLRRHPEEGARIVEPLRAWLGDWVDAVGQHHERYDGNGYPRGLVGEDIALAGRIVAITDSFETMTAVRSYKKPASIPAARVELVRCAGTHFDPNVVRTFVEISLGRLPWRIRIAAWIADLPLVGFLSRVGAQIGSLAGPAAASGALAAGLAALAVTAGLTFGHAGSGVPTLRPIAPHRIAHTSNSSPRPRGAAPSPSNSSPATSTPTTSQSTPLTLPPVSLPHLPPLSLPPLPTLPNRNPLPPTPQLPPLGLRLPFG